MFTVTKQFVFCFLIVFDVLIRNKFCFKVVLQLNSNNSNNSSNNNTLWSRPLGTALSHPHAATLAAAAAASTRRRTCSSAATPCSPAWTWWAPGRPWCSSPSTCHVWTWRSTWATSWGTPCELVGPCYAALFSALKKTTCLCCHTRRLSEAQEDCTLVACNSEWSMVLCSPVDWLRSSCIWLNEVLFSALKKADCALVRCDSEWGAVLCSREDLLHCNCLWLNEAL